MPSATALNGADFNPGMIISDELFYDGAALTSVQIQNFLDAKIGTCQNSNCLNIVMVPYAGRAREVSSTTGNVVCEAIPAGTFRASELIYRAQLACGISAKVILVTLQKEQSLVTSRAPTDRALRAAMGMGCPDTAPCSDAYAGLGQQIVSGTRQLKAYKAARFARQPGTHFIGYNPNPACGGTNVNVQNYATAALYNYTPYQPNAAALQNLTGTGNSCSAYGNRNFWRFYNDWFGSTIALPCTSSSVQDINRYWEQQGGSSGALGAAVSPGVVVGAGGVTVGYYTNGDVYCKPRVGPVAVLTEVRTKYLALGGATSSLGLPSSAQTPFTAGGISGALQYFDRGLVMSSSGTGTYAVLDGVIRTAWGNAGGSGGSLGWPTGDQATVSGGVAQRFQRGLVMVPTGKAPIILAGAIADYWISGSNSTTLGVATASSVAWTAGGVSGSYQTFDRGMVMSSAATGTAAVLNGPVRNVWSALGGSGGSLGWPTADQVPVASGGYSQAFQRGTVFVSAAGVGSTVSGAILTYWQQGSNLTLLGFPKGPQVAWTAGGVTGVYQVFERGMVMSSTSTGTHAVLDGPIRELWGARGGSGGSLGWPIGSQAIVSGVLQQQFQRGTLTAGATSTPGPADAITTYWSTGSNASRLGQPIASSVPWSAGGVSGHYRVFERGMVMSSTTTGTFAVLNGPIRDRWGALGGSGGSLGWPIADQEVVAGKAQQRFQHGTVTEGGGIAVAGPIADYWESGSNSAKLGQPTDPPVAWTAGGVTGSYQLFERGMVMSSTATGTYSVLNGTIRNEWGARGGSGGVLGWPTSDQESVAGGVRQSFQHGLVLVPTGQVAMTLSGPIGAYVAAGTNASRLGFPTSGEISLTAGGVTGVYQSFGGSIVLSSSSTGTFAVLDGPIRAAWGTRGGTSGSLGWPTADQEAIDGGLRQKFHRGALLITSSGAAITVTGDIGAYWVNDDRDTILGFPLAGPVPWSANGVTGVYQDFEHGMIMSSSVTGTHAVLHGPIRNAWGARGGSGGSLGWPTGDEFAVPEGTRQEFQFGSLVVPDVGEPYVVAG